MQKYHYAWFVTSCMIFFNLGLHAKSSTPQEPYFLDKIREETPSAARIGSIALANLNLNRQGNVAVVYPKEKVFAMVNIACDENDIDPYTLHQIVIGYEEGEAQKCIFNEFRYRLGNSITSFFLEAPETPGVYNIQFQLEQAYSPLEAMQCWGEENSLQMTIGKIIVLGE
ncbi:MAG: hypothetical protein V4489_10085 [Chlamydiota bacterium]